VKRKEDYQLYQGRAPPLPFSVGTNKLAFVRQVVQPHLQSPAIVVSYEAFVDDEVL
jgi:hypothetical protein